MIVAIAICGQIKLAVSEPDMIELNAARAYSFAGKLGREDVNRRIQQFEDAFTGSHGRLQDVVFVAQVLDGAEESLGVLHESGQHAKSDRIAKRAEAAEVDDHGNGGAGKNFHHRIVERVSHDGVFIGVHVLGVDAVKLAV